MGEELFKKVELPSTSPEYQGVARGFLSTAKYNICKVSLVAQKHKFPLFACLKNSYSMTNIFPFLLRLNVCKTSTCGKPSLYVGSESLPRTVLESLGRGFCTTAHLQHRATALRETNLTGAMQEHMVRSVVICSYTRLNIDSQERECKSVADQVKAIISYFVRYLGILVVVAHFERLKRLLSFSRS